jgi:hypothetical protein
MLFSHTATITENGQVVIINVSNGFAGINYEINKDLYEL